MVEIVGVHAPTLFVDVEAHKPLAKLEGRFTSVVKQSKPPKLDGAGARADSRNSAPSSASRAASLAASARLSSSLSKASGAKEHRLQVAGVGDEQIGEIVLGLVDVVPVGVHHR
jgi:hypothetical protein